MQTFNWGIIIILIVLRVSFCLIASYLSASSLIIIFDWELSQIRSIRIQLPVLLDVFSCIFIRRVALISAAVLIFSKSYISHEKHFLRFHLLVLRFIISMVLLIVRPNLIRILLGWDGLGVTSYLLVIYFQRTKSYNAGLLTALTNRVGDVLILVAISNLLIWGSWNFRIWAHVTDLLESNLLIILLFMAASTKSAQVPFSAWLPAAIAAPTPVSSLVHSSTLVTAGVYLLFRFSEIVADNFYLNFILYIGLRTIILAGVSALYEQDIKKIVALSTLRQLGLIIATIGLKFYELAFFHLLTHAYFKALLFITVGNIIHLSRDYQDLRKIRLLGHLYPVTLAFRVVANCSLCGLPFLGGFYSKDMILELIILTKSSWVLLIFMFLAVALTVAYTRRFVFLITSKVLSYTPRVYGRDNDNLINNSIAVLWPLAVIGGRILIWLLCSRPSLVRLPLELKNLTLEIILITLIFRLWITSLKNITQSNSIAWSWGAIWALPFVRSVFINFFSLNRSANLRKLDLSWVTRSSWSILFSFENLVNWEKSLIYRQFNLQLIIMSWFIVIILFFYLRILKLFNSWKIKTFCAWHRYVL